MISPFMPGCCAKRSLRSSASQKQMFRPLVSQSVSSDFGDFYQKNMRGGHMPLSSEVLKHRFWRYFEKSGPPLCYQWQMPTTFGQVLDDFFEKR